MAKTAAKVVHKVNEHHRARKSPKCLMCGRRKRYGMLCQFEKQIHPLNPKTQAWTKKQRIRRAGAY